MNHRIVLPALLSMTLGVSSSAFSFHCFLTVMKDSCWTDYNVTVVAMDSDTNKPAATITIPKGQSWGRQEFNCQPKETLNYLATFSPVFWKQDEGKQYSGKRTWSLPEQIQKGMTAWNITVCYPEQFAEVPLPPTAGGNCTCDARNIPPVVAPKTP